MKSNQLAVYNTLARVLDALVVRANDASTFARCVNAYNKTDTDRELRTRINRIKLQVEMAEYHLAKAENEA